jgi:hypothetical protein
LEDRLAIPGRKKKRNSGHGAENDLHNALDSVLRFREIEKTFLPEIQKDLQNGMTSEQILKKYKPHAAAALVTNLANPNQSISAAEKILDRTDGKPTQKTETTHRFEKLSEEELDSFLTSQMLEVDADEKKDIQ